MKLFTGEYAKRVFSMEIDWYELLSDKTLNNTTSTEPSLNKIDEDPTAATGVDELTVGNNSSFKANLDGSWATWKGEQRTWTGSGYTAWTNTTMTVGTIEDHSIVNGAGQRLDGGVANRPPNQIGNTYYRWPDSDPIAYYYPTDKYPSGDTQWELDAEATLGVCDESIKNMSDVRAYLGAQMNRLMYAGNVATISSENLSAAESRLRDANMSNEVVKQMKESILTQAAITVLAQANQRPEGVLQLLR